MPVCCFIYEVLDELDALGEACYFEHGLFCVKKRVGTNSCF